MTEKPPKANSSTKKRRLTKKGSKKKRTKVQQASRAQAGRPAGASLGEAEVPQELLDERLRSSRRPVAGNVRSAGETLAGDDGPYRGASATVVREAPMHQPLLASEQSFAAAVEASGAGVFEHDLPFGRVLSVSDRWAAILGYRRDEIPQTTSFRSWLEKRIHPTDLVAIERAYGDLTSGRSEEYRLESRVRHRGGEWLWVKVWARVSDPVSAGDPGRRTVVGVMMDVTEEKGKSLELERRARQLRRLANELHDVEERERREIAAELHDDLAQLVVALKMKLTILSQSSEAASVREEISEGIDLLERADRSVRSLTFQVSPPVLEELGLCPALDWLGRHLEEQYGLRVQAECGDDVRELEPRLRFILFRAIRELLINVAKHAGADRARLEVARSGKRGIRVVVSDEGRGFDPEQLHDEETRGFGLFSIQERIESLGGSFEVSSSENRGTRVTLMAPLGAPASPLPEPRVEMPEGLKGKDVRRADDRIRVLLVDDHALLRGALARMLAARPDVDVIGEASDGESAVAMAEELAPDVVLMDVTMPGMGGIEATRQLLRIRPETRVIGLSMHESEDVATAMRAAGASAYLQKSMPAEKLWAAIHDAREPDPASP